MAFTFLVEDGTGLPGANSYVSIAEANNYLTANIHVFGRWSALPSVTRESLLAWSSRYLDQRASWHGKRVNAASGLRWPRANATNADGDTLSPLTIPRELKAAVCEMARYLINEDRSDDRGQDALKELQVDVIRLVFDTAYRLPEVPNEIQFILRGLGTIAAGRPTYAKIIKA